MYIYIYLSPQFLTLLSNSMYIYIYTHPQYLDVQLGHVPSPLSVSNSSPRAVTRPGARANQRPQASDRAASLACRKRKLLAGRR